MINKIETISKIVNDIIEAFLAISLMFLFVIVIFQVGGRYFFGYSVAWLQEAVRYLLGFMCFIGVSCLIYRRNLLNIDILPDKIKFKSEIAYKLLGLLTWILIILYSRIMIQYGLQYAERGIGQLSTSLTFELYKVRLIIPIAGVFMVFQSLVNIIVDIRDIKELTISK